MKPTTTAPPSLNNGNKGSDVNLPCRPKKNLMVATKAQLAEYAEFLEKELQTTISQRGTLQVGLDNADILVSKLQTKVTSKENHCVELRSELDDTRVDLGTLRNTTKRGHEKNEWLREQLEQAAAKVTRLRVQLRESNNELSSVKETHKALFNKDEREYENLEKEIKYVRKEIEKAAYDYRIANGEVIHMQYENDILREQLEEAVAEVNKGDSIADRITLLETGLDNLATHVGLKESNTAPEEVERRCTIFNDIRDQRTGSTGIPLDHLNTETQVVFKKNPYNFIKNSSYVWFNCVDCDKKTVVELDDALTCWKTGQYICQRCFHNNQEI